MQRHAKTVVPLYAAAFRTEPSQRPAAPNSTAAATAAAGTGTTQSTATTIRAHNLWVLVGNLMVLNTIQPA